MEGFYVPYALSAVSMFFPPADILIWGEKAEIVKFSACKLTAHGCPLHCGEATDSKDGTAVVEYFVRPAVYWNQKSLHTASKHSN